MSQLRFYLARPAPDVGKAAPGRTHVCVVIDDRDDESRWIVGCGGSVVTTSNGQQSATALPDGAAPPRGQDDWQRVHENLLVP